MIIFADVYADEVLQAHLQNVTIRLGSARLGPDGVEHVAGDDALGAWTGIAKDGRLLFFQTTFGRPDGPRSWTDFDRSYAARAAFEATVSRFGGVEIDNQYAPDGSWIRYLGVLADREGVVAVRPAA